MRSNRNLVLMVGALLGAIVGVAAGHSLLKRAEDTDRPMLTASEGISLGALIIGLLRQIATLGDDD
ncbi:MAG: hypothetical protein KIS85_08740 [Anaerolineales bacterium]|nr:hypothetical protein [Anaerolineales bacterium]